MHKSPIPICAQVLSGSLILASFSSPDTQAMAVSWLSTCKANENEKHVECNNFQAEYLPTRLLDMDEAIDSNMLRLVSPKAEPQAFAERRDYITVSHCWGTSDNPLLTDDNFEERQQSGIHISKLPRTFQDAIQVAQWYNGT